MSTVWMEIIMFKGMREKSSYLIRIEILFGKNIPGYKEVKGHSKAKANQKYKIKT